MAAGTTVRLSSPDAGGETSVKTQQAGCAASSASTCKSGTYFSKGGTVTNGGYASLLNYCSTSPQSEQDCPAGTHFQNIEGPECVPAYMAPQGPGDCRSTEYYVPKGGKMPDGTTSQIAQCVNKATEPRNASDCPSNTYYIPLTQATPDPNIQTAGCLLKKDYPRDASDCPSTMYFVPAGSNYVNSGYTNGEVSDRNYCISKFNNPRNQADCGDIRKKVYEAHYNNDPNTAACVDPPSLASCEYDPYNNGCAQLYGGVNGKKDCESNAGKLGWFVCEVIDGVQSAIGGIYDHIINPLLTVEPISTSNKTGSQIYSAWSNFRIYGDVFLFIALLVIVFGESIGGGVIDAYSAKKILPRLLIAALLINISFYLVAIMVDIANIVGNGLSDLIIAPFNLSGNFNLQVNTTGSVGLTTLLAGAVTWATISLSGQFLAWLWFSILLPLLLVFLSILVVVLLRQALIVFLVIISPVAFALYCLPNTEKYFRKWWDILFETLLVFPIVTALFAMGKVSAYILSNSNNGALLNGLSQIMGVVALVIPLLLIPFSFKLAGGLLGRAHDLVSGARTKMNLGGATRERIKAQGARNRLQARGGAYAALQKQGSKGGAFRRNTVGRLAKGTSGLLGYNVEAEMSAARAEVGKTLNDQIATGKDDEIRGLTVNKAWANKQWRMDENGKRVNDWVQTDSQGRTQYKSLGGAWVNEADVDRGHSRWGKDTFAQQTALSYEMRKAQSEDQLQTLAKNYRVVAQGVDAAGNKVGGGWGMTQEQAGGAWIGAAFERQNEHLEFKGVNWKTGELNVDEATGLAGGGFVDEVYEKKGSYPVSQMGSNTVEQLKKAHASTVEVLRSSSDPDVRAKAEEQQRKIAAIAETFMHDVGTGGGMVGQTEDGAPIMGAPAGGGKRQAGTQGAAHVAERVVELAELTGVRTQPFGPVREGQVRTDDMRPQK
ncbi:MAG TPA: hypothetical protein VN031_01120 [Candidatus Microsaccharimonas sp.]|nr:hypothetical protein [Candidatus Microsaccharimonas sp.]